jgi:hypothetical protein
VLAPGIVLLVSLLGPGPLLGLGPPLATPPPAPVPIVGGEPVSLYGWTNVVALLSQESSSTANLCSGTLVAPHVVLTAAHCLEHEPKLDDMRVVFGDTIYTKDATRISGVADYGMYPTACTADCKGDAYDFGYVILAQDVVGIDMVPPILTQEEWNETMHVGNEIHVVGFGTTVDSEVDPLLMTNEVGHKRIMTTPIDSFTDSRREFRAGGEGQDACGGDSGGPAFVKLENGEYRLAGVTSRGVRPCGKGNSVYGVPYPILTWLREETGVDLLPDECPDGDCLVMARPASHGCDAAGPQARGWSWAWTLPLLLLSRRRRGH